MARASRTSSRDPAAAPGRRHAGWQPAAAHPSLGAAADGAGGAAGAVAGGSLRRQPVVVARRGRDRLRLLADVGLPRAVRHPHRCRRRGPRDDAGRRDPGRDERAAAVLARRPPPRVRLDPRRHRHHLAARARRRARRRAAIRSAIRAFPMNGAWMADVVWAADSQSLLVTMNEGTFATRRADVRDAGRARVAGERPRRARAPARLGRLQPEPQPRRPHPGLPRGGGPHDGGAHRHRPGERRASHRDRGESRRCRRSRSGASSR